MITNFYLLLASGNSREEEGSVFSSQLAVDTSEGFQFMFNRFFFSGFQSTTNGQQENGERERSDKDNSKRLKRTERRRGLRNEKRKENTYILRDLEPSTR